jgi:hypothetical protein
LDISYETVRRWFPKFGQVYARSIRQRRHRPTDRWHLDEMVIVMGRRRFYLCGPSTARARSWISWSSVAGIPDVLLTVLHDIGQMVGVPTPFIDSVLGLARLRATSLGLLVLIADGERLYDPRVYHDRL